MVRVFARLDITGAGNGPSPRWREARIAFAPTIHHSGWSVSSWIIRAFRSAVSGAIAASWNKEGSNGRVSVMAFLLDVSRGILLEGNHTRRTADQA
jgi:hypothetical protein